MKQNQIFLVGYTKNLISVFVGHKILNYFNDFYHWHLSLKKLCEIKLNKTHANLTVFFIIYKVVHNLNDFWNLLLDKIYLKNEW